MGTSGSSKGSPGNVPMVPPWVPPVPPPAPGNASPPGTPSQPDQAAQPPASAPTPAAVPIASARRFVSARRSAGSFAKSGSARDLKRAMGHYVQKGYGGAHTAARRFGGTVRNAGSLYSALTPPSGAAAPTTEAVIDRVLLAGRSAGEIMDAIVNAVQPVNGTQDAEASRTAIKGSLSEVLQRFPEANLLELTNEQRDFAIECYVALDVYQRFSLDLGKVIQDKAPSPRAVVARLKEVKDYIEQTVSAAFRKLKGAGQRLSSARLTQIVQSALVDALAVFVHYRE
jgi:hypothetical protein